MPQNTIDGTRIGIQSTICDQIGDQGQALVFRFFADGLKGRFQRGVNRQGFAVYFNFARFKFRHVENVGDHGKQGTAAFGNVMAIITVFIVAEWPEHFLFHDFGETKNRIERRTQIMAHLGQKF